MLSADKEDTVASGCTSYWPDNTRSCDVLCIAERLHKALSSLTMLAEHPQNFFFERMNLLKCIHFIKKL